MVDEDVAKKAKCCCCVSCCCGWSITFLVLAIMSWKTVSQGQIALHFSHWSQSVVGAPITESGMKYVGPLNDLIRYPSVYQMLYFDEFSGYTPVAHEQVKPPILSRTYDGLKVSVRVSFQWKLSPEHLTGIYSLLGAADDLDDDNDRPEEKPSFVEALVRMARGTLTFVCAEYTAAQFFANQSLVQSRMLDKLTTTFNQPEKSFVITVQGLQLRSVDLPNEYENSIAETQKEEQDFQTATAERATKQMKMSTTVMQAEQQVFELKKAAEANASKIMAENLAWVEQYRLFQRKQAEAYKAILDTLVNTEGTNGVCNDDCRTKAYDNLFELMRQKALKEHHPDKMTLSA